MLTYFPTPYPEEWWYSVLCRYYVRSGYHNFATVSKELYGGKKPNHGRLFPGSSEYQVVANLPADIFDLEQVLLGHTLMPYYLRFYPRQKKQMVFQTLLCGKSSGITSIDLLGMEREEGLQYCPICYQEDVQQFGEPFWHREHQIPLMPLCNKHKIPLVRIPVKYNRLSEIYLPLSSIALKTRCAFSEKAWMEPLTKMLTDFLKIPFEQGPPQGYSNLEVKLAEIGLETQRIQRKQLIDAKKVCQAVDLFFGNRVAKRYFSNFSSPILYRLCNWSLASPERYALLTVMAGLSAEELFGRQLANPDPYLKKLLYMRERGIVYQKGELAAQIGVSPAQLDTLAQKYNIQPFWKQCGRDDRKRTEVLRITLTREEKQSIVDAAKDSGNGQVSVYARTILLQTASKKVLKDKKRGNYGTPKK